MSLFRCCAGSRRRKLADPAKASSSPGSRPNGQQRHDVTTSGDRESHQLRTHNLPSSEVTSSADDQDRLTSRFPRSDAANSSVENSAGTRRVVFPPSVVSGDVAAGSNVTPSSCSTSPIVDADVFYSAEDYDNTGNDEQVTTTPVTNREPSPGPRASSSAAVPPRTPVKSSEEESLDQLVAHLLGEVTPTAAGQLSPSTDSRDSNRQQPTPSDLQSSTSLRWPQGDSLPRVDVRPTVRSYNGPTPANDSDAELLTKQLRADENDNVVKCIESQDLRVPTVTVPVELLSTDVLSTPPLPTIRKKITPSAESVPPSSNSKPSELVTELDDSAKSDAVQVKQREHEYSVPSSLSTENRLRSETEANSETSDGNLTAQQLSQVGRVSNESDSKTCCDEEQTTAKNAETPAPAGKFSVEVQQTSLLEQFKMLRLEVLTSTSQLLSCVSGTWKRGESFRSKLTTITQLCLALRTSVAKLETFLQSALSSAIDDTSSQVETANTRIRNLQAIQASIDVYIETLEAESAGGPMAMTGKQDLKVGGIIHLTKEIPGLVRTFAPAVEYLATLNDVITQRDFDASAVATHQSDSENEGAEVQPTEKPFDENLDRGKQQYEEEVERTDDKTNTNPNLPQQNSDISDAVQSFHTHNEHEVTPVVRDDFQQALVNASASHSNSSADVPHNDVVDTADEREKTDHNGFNTELVRQVVSPPPLPDKVDSPPPPTPPPKLRVASRFHASLGISNSLTAAEPAPVNQPDSADIRPQRNLDVKYSIEEKTDIETSADRLQYHTDDRIGGRFVPHMVTNATEVNYASGWQEEVVSAADRTHFRFPRAADTGSSSEQPAVVLRRPAELSDVDVDDGRRYRVSESELETPEFRVSGVSQTMVDQLEALQRDANAVAVVTHTDAAAGYDLVAATNSPISPNYQSTLSADDRRLLMFYCSQMTGHWNVLDSAASAFFLCMDRRQPPKVFVSHSKFVIVAGHKMAYIGDVLARNLADDNAQDWIVTHSNRLCNSLKLAVRATKEAALAYPDVPTQQLMVDYIKDVTDWAIELKEVVDRLAYLGRPDHVLA